jgi:hypothetical protein
MANICSPLFDAGMRIHLFQDGPEGAAVPIVVAMPWISDSSQQSHEADSWLLGDKYILEPQPERLGLIVKKLLRLAETEEPLVPVWRVLHGQTVMTEVAFASANRLSGITPAVRKCNDQILLRDSDEFIEYHMKIIKMLQHIDAENTLESTVIERESFNPFEI